MIRGSLALLLAALPAFVAAEPYNLNRALEEWGSLVPLQHPADPPRRLGMLSSYDRNGANFDQGNFQREESDGQKILADLKGPGVLTRLWTAEPMGTLLFYWDDSPTPQLAVPWLDLQAGRVPPLMEPFVTSKGGGCTMRFPLPYAKSLRVALAEKTWCHWQIHYQYFNPETEVVSWWPALGPPPGADLAFTRAANAWEKPDRPRGLGAEILTSQLALSVASPIARFTAPKDVMVTELAFAHVNGPVLPEDFLVAIDQDGQRVELPWRTLAGVWDSTKDAPGLLQGRLGNRSWMRVPFALRAGEAIACRWAGREGEVLGDLTVTGRLLEANESASAPRLIAYTDSQQTGMGKFFDSGTIAGNGRLLAVGTRARARNIAYYMEGDESIFLEGEAQPSFHGTGMEDLFDSAWYFSGGQFTTAVSAAPMVSKDWLNTAARVNWWPLGIPFTKSIRFELEGGSGNIAPPTTHNLVLLGQRFGPPLEVPPPQRTEPTLNPREIGLRTADQPDSAGLPTYLERTAPISAICRPVEGWVDAGTTIEGTFDISLTAPTAYLMVALDVPFGWKGSLEGLGQTKEVFDLGWPPLEKWDAPPQQSTFKWKAFPPAVIQPGDTVVQLRAEVRMADGSTHTVRHPVRLRATTAGTPLITWKADEIQTSGTLEAIFRLPQDFKTEPGDIVNVDARLTDPTSWTQGEAQLLWRPIGPTKNATGYEAEILPHFPRDGQAPGRIRFGGEPHPIAFRPGQFQSWEGAPRTLVFSMKDYPNSRMEVLGAALYRHPPYPQPDRPTERIAYRESAQDRFDAPRYRTLIAGADLRRAMAPVVATPQDQILMERVPSEYLENAEAGPVKWRLANPQRRIGGRPPSEAILFPARHVGERAIVRHESIRGAHRIGIQFAYGPWCGTVAVRDCEGRLAAVQELYMNRDATFPQYTQIDLVVPSRDPWIYLEALAPSPGGLEVRIPVVRVLVLE